LGIDGYRHGWVVVALDDGQRTIAYVPSIRAALAGPFDAAMIDMPIGLPERGNRACDTQGKALLGAAGSRVFLGARRPLFDFQSAADANTWAFSVGKKGISCQLWCLLKKMREVEAAIAPARQSVVLECHPELVFFRLNGGKPVSASKKSPEGVAARTNLLLQDGFAALPDWLQARTRNPFDGRAPGAGKDDVLDACACAIAARDKARRIPEDPPCDAWGLRMEIWF